MASKKTLLILVVLMGCGLSFAKKAEKNKDHAGDEVAKTEKKKRSSEKTTKRPTSCESSIVQENLQKLFKEEKDRKEIAKLAAEIARRTPLEADEDAKKLLALAKKNAVCVVDAIAAITQPESGMDENQIHKLIQVASNELKESEASRKVCAQQPPAPLNRNDANNQKLEQFKVLQSRYQQSKGRKEQEEIARQMDRLKEETVEILQKNISTPTREDKQELERRKFNFEELTKNFKISLGNVAGTTSESDMETALRQALRAGLAVDRNFSLAKLHVLIHAPDITMRNLPAADKTLRTLADKAAQDSLVNELNGNKALDALKTDDKKAFADLLRAYQNHDFAGDPDEGHEKAEGLAEFAIEHGFTGALPALVSQSKARYCLFAGADPQKLAEIEKELAEKVEAIADKYGYKHLDPDNMAAALRKMGNSAADSEDFLKGANALIGEMTHGLNKMSFADALFFADQANLVQGQDKKKAFAELVKEALLSEGSPRIDFGEKTPKEKQSFNADISEIQAENDPQKVQSLTTDLLKKAKKMGLSTDNVLTKLTSDSFLLSAEADKLAEKAGDVIPKRQAMLQANALMQAQESAGKDAIKDIAKLAKLDVLGGLGGVEDGGDKNAPQKSATWKTLADKVLAKAGTDKDVRDALQKMSDNKYWMGPRADYMTEHLPQGEKTEKKDENRLQPEGETRMDADPKAPEKIGAKKTEAGTPSVGSQLVGATNNLMTGNLPLAALNLGAAYLTSKNSTPTNKTEPRREMATRRQTPTGTTSKDAELAARMGGACVECHKNQGVKPKFRDNASPEEILADVKKKVGNSPEAIASILADMTSRAIVEKRRSREEALAFVRVLNLKGQGGKTELSKSTEFLQPFEAALPIERKTQDATSPGRQSSSNKSSTPTTEIAKNTPPPPNYTPGATESGSPQPFNGFVAQPPEAGLEVGASRVLSAPSANDQSTGVVNFVIGNDGRPLVVKPGGLGAAPLHAQPPGGRLPNYALVKNEKGYFYTNGQGQIPNNAQPIKPGEPINGSFFGLNPDTHVAMVYDGPGKVRFVPSAAAKPDSESFKVMANRRANANNGLAPPLKIPQVNPPTSFAEREKALRLAGYNPANFDESSPSKMVTVVPTQQSGAQPQPLVIDATRRVQGSGNVTMANTGFAFVGSQPAKLLAAPSTEALKLNGETEIANSRSGLHVDVKTDAGKAERLWVAKDVSGTYLIRVPLTQDSSGKVVGPDPDGQTRVEKLLEGEKDIKQGLAFLETAPQKPFADDKARTDTNDPRHLQLFAYAQEEGAAPTPVAPATGNATAEPIRATGQPQNTAPPPRQATPQARAQVPNPQPIFVRTRTRADIRQERRANFRGLFR